MGCEDIGQGWIRLKMVDRCSQRRPLQPALAWRRANRKVHGKLHQALRNAADLLPVLAEALELPPDEMLIGAAATQPAGNRGPASHLQLREP